MSDAVDRLHRVLETHFDPRFGSPFWLERARALGFDPRSEIREISDLERLGPMPLDELATRPVEHFIPRRFHDQLDRFVSSETGGTTGPPKRTAFLDSEFQEAFVAPFVRAAELVGFPLGQNWLFLGPSGPHVIGKAARACARATGSLDPFAIDIDPRWARRLPEDSLARRRYLDHLLAQALGVIRSQEIGVLFATPPLLAALGERLERSLRERVVGLHLGGIAAEPSFWTQLEGWFPNAVSLSGYGNSLAGMCPQLEKTRNGEPEYFPHGARLILSVDAASADERGRVRFHRLDEGGFLPNVVERDEAQEVSRPPDVPAHDFQPRGIRDPRPPVKADALLRQGIY